MYRKSITKRHFGATEKYLVLSEFQVDQSDEGAPVKKAKTISFRRSISSKRGSNSTKKNRTCLKCSFLRKEKDNQKSQILIPKLVQTSS